MRATRLDPKQPLAGAWLGGAGALWLFILLKTAADVALHRIEHRWLQSGSA